MLQRFADWLTYEIIGLDVASRLGEAVNFFVYDTIKVLLLLFGISAIMGIINAYLPIEKLRKFLTQKKLMGVQYFLAAVFGAMTPFCSCSSIPLFIGFVRGGIPLGVTFSFLITSPLINEVAVAMLAGTFGWKTTLIYIASGLLLGTLGGYLLGRMRLERFLSDWVRQMPISATDESAEHPGRVRFIEQLPKIVKDSWSVVRGVLLYVLIGIGIGAAIHGYVPEAFFEKHLQTDSWYAVPLTVIFAVPMYANVAGIVPVVEVLVSKGVAIGTAIAFMMGVVGLSLPEAMMLKRAMSWRLIGIFFGTVTLCVIGMGYLFNAVL